PGQGVPAGRKGSRVCEHCCPSGFFRGEEGQEKQRPDPEQREHPAQKVPEAPGGKGGGVGHPEDGHAPQHLPAVEQEHQHKPGEKFVPQQALALIEKNFTQGSGP
ncbi:FtsX-like permease family, partial [Dysosmobacter welbionis]